MSDRDLTPEELAMLTPAERAGLEDDDDGDDNEEVIEDEELSAEAKAAAEGEGEDETPPAKQDEEQPGAKQEAEGEDEQGAQQQETTQAAQPVPLFKADLPEDIDAKFKDIDSREEALIEKFEDGDLTTREYNAELRKLNKERSDLEWLQRKAELSQESSQTQREQQWYNDVGSFVKAHPLIEKNETMWNSFDAVLRKVTATTIAAGGWPGQADIEKAYKQWSEDLGISTDTPSPKPAPAAEKKDTPAPAAAKKELKVPPTLANVPAASHEDTDDGKYAHLDRLADEDPLAYEEAIKKLSPGEWEEYSQSR